MTESPLAGSTDTKLLIYGLFQEGRVLAQDGIEIHAHASSSETILIVPAQCGCVGFLFEFLGHVYELTMKGVVIPAVSRTPP